MKVTAAISKLLKLSRMATLTSGNQWENTSMISPHIKLWSTTLITNAYMF